MQWLSVYIVHSCLLFLVFTQITTLPHTTSFYIYIKDTTDSVKSSSYLDFHLEIENEGLLKTKLYDKRDDFSFQIVNFPFLCSNIPAAPAYGVYISQLKRYSWACISYHRQRVAAHKKTFKQRFPKGEVEIISS